MPIDAIIDRAAAMRVEAALLETHKNWIGGSRLRSAELSAQVLRRRLPQENS
ncbi:hypothetical protein [Agromyces sp. SYSU T00266]|uniref:hypothetical protein n=1 Tax=Agromyces zhanjiangensis TaxID=3158562 RepID=UPI0033915176